MPPLLLLHTSHHSCSADCTHRVIQLKYAYRFVAAAAAARPVPLAPCDKRTRRETHENRDTRQCTCTRYPSERKSVCQIIVFRPSTPATARRGVTMRALVRVRKITTRKPVARILCIAVSVGVGWGESHLCAHRAHHLHFLSRCAAELHMAEGKPQSNTEKERVNEIKKT